MSTLVQDYGGTTSALTIGTETQVGSTDVSVGMVGFLCDTTNMALGDILEIRAYIQNISSGSDVQMWKGTYSNVQINPMKYFPMVPNLYGIKFTLKQTAGTGRTYNYSIIRG